MLREFSYKQFGQLLSSHNGIEESTLLSIAENIKILFLPKNRAVKIDFQSFTLEKDALLFINPNVKIQLSDTKDNNEILLHFNRDFYCIEIHDHEVACDGILYNNVFEIPFIELTENQAFNIRGIIEEIQSEMQNEDSNTEEMLRTLLKLIILKSTRIWKEKHKLSEEQQQADVYFLRKFSKLVEDNYKTHHTVADYAEMLFMTPKSLSKKISLLSKETPNDIIKKRIILESKRLLAHTAMTVKEIAYHLNYEDDAYFVRFFTKHSGVSPTSFRKQF